MILVLRRNDFVHFHNESSNGDVRRQRRQKYFNIGTGQKQCADGYLKVSRSPAIKQRFFATKTTGEFINCL
jgi:hypothetical protein